MSKVELIQWLIRHNYIPDKYGNYQKQVNDKTLRFKLQKNSARHEVLSILPKTDYSPKQSLWIRLSSGYYKDLFINPDNDKLGGMKY